MGGDYIPNSFAPAPEGMWQRLSSVVSPDDWYRFVAVTRDNARELRLRNGRELTVVPIRDEVIEVFQTLRSLGDGSAIIFDRLFQKCWTTTWTDAGPFLDYSMTIDDEYCEPVED